MRDDVLSFVQVFGDKQNSWNRLLGRMCPESICGAMKGVNDARAKSEEDAYNDILRDFWMRSVFRKIKGLPIGAFPLKYDEAWDTFDMLKSNTLILANLGVGPLYQPTGRVDNDELNRNFDKTAREQVYIYEKALNKASSKARFLLKGGADKFETGINGEKGTGTLIASGYTNGLFDFVNSMGEAVKGSGDRWKATYLVLKLLAADMYEEKLIRSVGGMARMQAYYQKRYVDVPAEQRAFYKSLIEQNLWIVRGQRGVVSRNGDVNTVDTTSIKGVAGRLRDVLDTWVSRISEARVKELQIRAAEGRDTTEEFQVEDERASDL
jgi:hypothetical protein